MSDHQIYRLLICTVFMGLSMFWGVVIGTIRTESGLRISACLAATLVLLGTFSFGLYTALGQ